MSDTRIRTTANNGFWIDDSFVHLLSYYITKAVENKDLGSLSKGVQEICDECADNLKFSYRGMVHIMLEEYIISNEEKSEMIQILNDSKSIINDLGDEISIEDLNAIENLKQSEGFKSSWQLPVKTSSLIGTLDIIEKMFKDEWKEPNNYGVWFKGYPHPKGAKTI